MLIKCYETNIQINSNMFNLKDIFIVPIWNTEENKEFEESIITI